MSVRGIKGSIPALLGLWVSLTGLTAAVTIPGADYIVHRSDSIVTNFYITSAAMLLLLLSSGAFGLLLIRLIWGPDVEQKSGPRSYDEEEEALDERAAMRGMRATGTKKMAVFIAALAVNTAVFDLLGQGVLISDTRATKVMTLLRSSDGQDRADAVTDAIILADDPRIASALRRVIEGPGPSREWAAYAAGIRGDKASSDALTMLMKSGNDRERAAAAIALARLSDERLVALAEEAFSSMSHLKGDIIKAVGMLGYSESTPTDTRATAGRFLTGLLGSDDISKDKSMRQLVIWAIGRFRAPEGLHAVEALLESGVESGTRCIGLQTIGRIGAAESSPRLVAAIDQIDPDAACPDVVYADFTGHEVLLSARMPVVERLLHDIANIGDRRARPAMVRVSKDPRYSKSVQSLAAEIAFQMKYKAVEKPSP